MLTFLLDAQTEWDRQKVWLPLRCWASKWCTLSDVDECSGLIYIMCFWYLEMVSFVTEFLMLFVKLLITEDSMSGCQMGIR